MIKKSPELAAVRHGLGVSDVERAGSNEGQTAELASSLAERTRSGEKIYQLNRSDHPKTEP